MQQTAIMPFTENIISSAVSVAVGWLAASVAKVSRSEMREQQAAHKELIKRVESLEKDLNGRMTRTEFEQAFNKVDLLVREFRTEARAEFKELKNELIRGRN